MSVEEAEKIIWYVIRSGGSELDLHIFDEKLTSDDLNELMPQILKIRGLRDLDVSLNQISDISAFSALKDLQCLGLSSNQISDISALAALKDLQWLSLSRNQVSDISALAALEDLQWLDLSSNQISDISPLTRLENLQELYLYGNAIADISGIKNLTNLEVIFLYRNHIKDLSALENLPNLREISLESLQIKKIPDLSRSRNLSKLLLYNNQIRDLSPLKDLENLRQLTLHKNQVDDISALADLENLETLRLEENPLLEEKIPTEILLDSGNPERIINYWFEISQKASHPLNEAKIVVIGEADIGKTFLINKLIYKKTVNTVSTHGIQIHHWEDVPINKEKVQLNVWDFGGQEMMHSTHEFFFTERTVYILVLDARKNEDSNKTAEWLNRIKSLAGDSPVMICGNQIDQNKRNPDQPGIGYFDINRRGLLDKYPNIKGFFPLCCDDRKIKNKGEKKAYTKYFNDFQKALINEIGLLDEIHKLFPANWFRIKNELQDMQKKDVPYMDHREYLSKCFAMDIQDKVSQETIVDFLNKVGTVIYFPKTDRDTMVFNPEWLTQGVYAITDSPFLKEKNGILHRDHLPELLNQEKYPPDKHDFIINMMRKFELCVDIERGKVFLVPDLLTSSQPDEIRNEDWQNTMGFQYHYEAAYLPSIMTSFIVKIYNYQHEQKYWKNGIVLKYKDSLALVKVERADKKIFISVKGKNLRNNQYLLSLIRRELKEIHERFADLKVKERVPHPEYPDIIEDYEGLILAEEDGEKEIYIKELRRKVFISEFLNGVVSKPDRIKEAKSNITNVYGSGHTILQDLMNTEVTIKK